MTAPAPRRPSYVRHSALQQGRPVVPFVVAAAIGAALSIATPNPGLALFSIAVLTIGGLWLWRPGEPPVLLMVFGIAWLGASSAIFQSNWMGMSIVRYSKMPADMTGATLLSLSGVLAMAAGMRWAAPSHSRSAEEARLIAVTLSVNALFQLYIVALVASIAMKIATIIIPGLTQLVNGFGQLRWAFFFILAYTSFSKANSSKIYITIAFIVELAQGLGAFFSDFKFVFLVSFAASAAAVPRLSIRSTVLLAGLAVPLLLLGAVWTAVKGDYRAFISGGSREQVVVVDYETRMKDLATRAISLSAEDLADGFDNMFRRISYVEFFGVVLNVVPNARPYTEGEILIDALLRPLMPRILFPDKPEINDTDRTNEFTGGWAGDQPGTSISIGYLGEFYIDFGIPGLLLISLGVGVLYGYIYRFLVQQSSVSPLLGMGMAAALLLPVGNLDNSFTKVFGGLVAGLLAAWIVARFIVPKFWPWLARRRPNRVA